MPEIRIDTIIKDIIMLIMSMIEIESKKTTKRESKMRPVTECNKEYVEPVIDLDASLLMLLRGVFKVVIAVDKM